MTDLNVDIASMNPEELAAFAARIGVPVEQLATPDYPDFRDGKGYKLRVLEAANVKSKLGADQVTLTVFALDANDDIVKRARGKLWINYPFDNAEFRFKDADARERGMRDLTMLLRAGAPDTRYNDYCSRVKEGNKNRYYDADGNELIGKDFTEYKNKARIRVFQELHARKDGDAALWAGTEFYAQYKFSEKDGVTYKNWQRLTISPVEGVDYISDPGAMLLRPLSGEAVKDDGEDLF